MTFRSLRNVRGFLSDYYLGSVFGRGTGRGTRKTSSDRETDLAYARFRRIRERAEGRATDAPACRERFIRPLLRDVLGFHLGSGESSIHRLFPSAEAEAAGEPPPLLLYCGAWDEDLDAGRGRTNPMRALGEALAQTACAYGFLVTGERMRLIRAPGDGPQGAYLEADLAGLDEDEDPESFAAFLKLFSAATFLPGEDGHPPIEAIERASREHAERVSEDLKQSVFRSAEAMVAGLIADAVTRGEIASPLDLDDAGLRTYRDAALLALYRILFILYAEARDQRLDAHTLYWNSYSGTGLLEEILTPHASRLSPEDWPDHRCFLWQRLRALFRIYDEGLPAISPWDYIPPRGGDFFSRTTPEGQILDRARLSDRQVAQLILDLATTTPRRGIGRERVSFRELDIESLGAVYEGLLEYEPRIAREVCLEVRVRGSEYVLPPAELMRLCQQQNLVLKGDIALVRGTEAERFHPDAEQEDEEGDNAEEVASDREEESADEREEEQGVKKGATVRLVRRLEPGTFHFVSGSGRKGSGSFYTPRELVHDLARHALGPLVAGKSAAEIERLRVLDPACGSAHFLVEAMRFLGQALHRAYVEEYRGKAPPEFRSTTGQGWDTNWRASDDEARAANSEARAWCKRRIAERCLFGVDLNPTAVQLAQVALWIESLAGDRPLTYFQHHIRCGNSLLGTWMDRLEEPPPPAKGFNRHQGRLPFQEPVRRAIREAARLRRLIDEARPHDLLREGIQPETTDEQRYKEHLRAQADAILAAARLLFDLRSASAFVPDIWREWDTLTSLMERHEARGERQRLLRYAEGRPWWPEFERVCAQERFFHWELEFPEIFVRYEAIGERQENEGESREARGEREAALVSSAAPQASRLSPHASPGFDAVLGNPPWEKIKPDRKEFYGRYDILIRAYVGGELDHRIRDLHAAHPGIPEAFRSYEERLKTLAACLKKGGDYRFCDWIVDGKTTGGDPDAFKFFVERAWHLAREGGRVGFVVPSAIYNNEGCTGLRHLLLEEARVERFYAFENRRKIFPIDSRYKFVNLVFRREARGEGREEGGDERDQRLQAAPGVATRHATNQESVSRNRSTAQVGGVRAQEPNAASGGLDSGQHRRGIWSPGLGGVPPSPGHEPRLAIGAGDASPSLPGSGVPGAGRAGAAAQRDRTAQPDAGDLDSQTSVTPHASRPLPDGSFEAAFMRHDPAELAATVRYGDIHPSPSRLTPHAPWMVLIRRRELERLSPGTLAFLEYRSPRDRDILLKMYGYDAAGNPVNPRPLLGDRGPHAWNTRFYREFDMTNDRDLWTDPKTGRLYNPRQILGNLPGTTDKPPYYDPAAWPEIRARMAEQGFWPLYEGKHIEQFLVDIRPIERWVSLEACRKKYGKAPDPGPKLVFRDIARNTDERTCIAAVLPERSCFGHTLSGLAANAPPESICAMLNAFVFDFALRFRTAGTHLSFTYLARMPVTLLPEQVAPQTVSGLSGLTQHILQREEYWPSIWLANRTVAEAYGLTPDDFAYILTTFPVFARKRPAFYAYLQARVQEWEEARGERREATGERRQAKGERETPRAIGLPPLAFQRAAVLAWAVHKLHSPGCPVSRFRVQKMLYLIEAATETGLFAGFRKQAAGPYDPDLRYGGPEAIAVEEQGWLVMPDDTHFAPGPTIEEALHHAPRYLDEVLAELVLEEFRAFKDETLERWTTVHLAAVELQREEKPVTPESVLAYIQSVPEWQPKLARAAFSRDRVADALEGLRAMGLLPNRKEDQS